MGSPLNGIVVLDMTRVLAGPMACVILEDLGAEVIKVEHPENGDDSRSFGPFLNDQSLYFMSINRGKKSIAIDLKNEQGRQLMKELISKVDVVVENFRPGTMEKLGLGYDDLKEINPRLIYGCISGFGHYGPDSREPAYDILMQAQSGLMSITGNPGESPVRVGYSVCDINGALFCAIGINAALYQRALTGKGQKVDVAMLDCQFAVLESALSRYIVDGVSPEPLGNRHPTIAPFQGFEGSDGHWFVVGAGNDNLYARLCNAIGAPELIGDKRFLTNKDRSENLDAIGMELQKIFSTNTMAHWMKVIKGAGVPCAVVNDMGQVTKDRQLIARNMFVECKDPIAGDVVVPGNPIKMTNIEEKDYREKAPQLGEHRDEILSRFLNMNPQEIEALDEAGVFGNKRYK